MAVPVTVSGDVPADSGGAAGGAPAPQGAVRPQTATRTAPRVRIACVSRSYGVMCSIAKATRASIRVVGRKQRATASGRGTVRVRLQGKVRRSARIEVRYTADNKNGRAVVRLGKTVRVSATR